MTGLVFMADRLIEEANFAEGNLGSEAVFDRVPVVPHVPGNIVQLKEKLLDPSFASIADTKPFILLLLSFAPKGGDVTHEEGIPAKEIL